MVAQDRLFRIKARYEACAQGMVDEADMLAHALCTEAGLLKALAKELSLKPKELKANIRLFALELAERYLENCRGGLDFMPHLYTVIRSAARFSAVFGRRGKKNLMLSVTVEGQLDPEEVHRERMSFISDMGATSDELEGLVLGFAREYVAVCQEKPTRSAVEDLGLLGADCGLNIEEVGVSEQEFRHWHSEVSRRTAKACLEYLGGYSLPELLKKRDQTRKALEDLCFAVMLDDTGEPLASPTDEWHVSSPLTPRELGLTEADLEKIQRIQLEFDCP